MTAAEMNPMTSAASGTAGMPMQTEITMAMAMQMTVPQPTNKRKAAVQMPTVRVAQNAAVSALMSLPLSMSQTQYPQQSKKVMTQMPSIHASTPISQPQTQIPSHTVVERADVKPQHTQPPLKEDACVLV